MKILLLARYAALGASSRVRFYQYLPFLRANGIHLDVAPLFDDDYLRALYAGNKPSLTSVARAYFSRLTALLRLAHYDLIWLETQLFPWLPARFENFLPRPYVADYDDAVFHRYDQHSSRVVRAVLGKSIDSVMRHARIVIAGNDYLAARARQARAVQVEILPSVVDGLRYQPAVAPPQGNFTLGWIGSPVTAPFLTLVKPALEEARKQAGVQITLVGGSLPGLEAVTVPWSESGEISAIQGFHVGIMPLPDAPFERGKCGYKLIQYMACGLPVIASPVGVNRQIIRHGETGFLAESHAEWLDAILTLKNSPTLRQKMGRAGRLRFEAEYSLQVTAPRLLALLQQAAQI